MVATWFLFILELLTVIFAFAWNLPSEIVSIDSGGFYSPAPSGAFIAFYALESVASAMSFIGIVTTIF